MSRTRAVRNEVVVALAIAIWSGACTSERNVMSPAPLPAIAPYVTGAALAALDGQGRFAQQSPGVDTLSAVQATSLANAYLKTYGVMAIGRYRRETGLQFELSQVQACGRAYLTTSPYASARGGSTQTQRYFAPHWLVTFCLGAAKPVISVSVSALANELVGKDLRDPTVDIGPGDFLEESIPPTMTGLPVAPEVAVRNAAELAGRRISAVPMLLQQPLPFTTHLAIWRMALERPVRVRGDRTTLEADEQVLYYGWALETKSMRLLRAIAADRTIDSTRGGSEGTIAERRLDLPSRFEAVVVAKASAVP